MCIELLKQARFPSNIASPIPRIELIQSLSLFVGCLEWVRPTDGNFEICREIRNNVKRIMELVLTPPCAVVERNFRVGQDMLANGGTPGWELSAFTAGLESPKELLAWPDAEDWATMSWTD